MENFCPVCMKNGVKSRIKSFQINLEEAVWSCENENCVWPMGYEELIFFERRAISCNWEESSLMKKSISLPIELSLYTPPVTPGGEPSKELTDVNAESFSSISIEEKLDEILNKSVSISSTEEFTGSNQILLGSFKLKSNNSIEKSRNIVEEKNANASAFRTLPKITNIQNANINLSSISEHCGNKKIQEQKHSHIDMETADITKDFDLFDDTHKELNTQCKEDSEQSKSGIVQLYDTASGIETNVSTKALSQTIKPTTDVNVINNLNTSSNFTLNTSGDLNVDAILDSILNAKNHTIEDIDDNWLNSLIS